MAKYPKPTPVQQVEFCCRDTDKPKTAIKQTIDHTANLTPGSARLKCNIKIVQLDHKLLTHQYSHVWQSRMALAYHSHQHSLAPLVYQKI